MYRHRERKVLVIGWLWLPVMIVNTCAVLDKLWNKKLPETVGSEF